MDLKEEKKSLLTFSELGESKQIMVENNLKNYEEKLFDK